MRPRFLFRFSQLAFSGLLDRFCGPSSRGRGRPPPGPPTREPAFLPTLKKTSRFSIHLAPVPVGPGNLPGINQKKTQSCAAEGEAPQAPLGGRGSGGGGEVEKQNVIISGFFFLKPRKNNGLFNGQVVTNLHDWLPISPPAPATPPPRGRVLGCFAFGGARRLISFFAGPIHRQKTMQNREAPPQGGRRFVPVTRLRLAVRPSGLNKYRTPG